MISIVVPWRNRDEIYRTQATFLAVAERFGGEFILVNYGGELDASRMLASSSMRILEVADVPHFNKAKANNLGASFACHDTLFFCDCDIIIDHDTAVSCVNLIESEASFVTIKNVKEEKTNSIKANHIRRFGYQLTIDTVDGRRVEIIDFEEDSESGIRNAPGLLFVSLEDFTAIEGYAGYLQGWGWEDQDMICRLTLGLGLRRHQHGFLDHLSHGDFDRMKEYPDSVDRWESRDRMFRKAIARYDQGSFSGTLANDIADHANNIREK